MTRPRRRREKSHRNQDIAIAASVLKRDAAKTDYIVVPLFAGLLANIALLVQSLGPDDGDPFEETPDLPAAARVILDDSQADDDSAWAEGTDRYTRTLEFVLAAWPLIFALTSRPYMEVQLAPYWDGIGEKDDVVAATEWLKANPQAPLLLTLLIAGQGVSVADSRRDEHPLFANSTRGIRVELARRLRDVGATRWPQVVRLAAAAWNADTLGRLALDQAASAEAYLEALSRVAAADEELDLAFDDDPFGDPDHPDSGIAATTTAQPDSSTSSTDVDALSAMRSQLEQTLARKETLEQQVATLRRERDAQADRHARSESHVGTLTEQIGGATERIKELEFQLLVATRERDELARLIFTDEQTAPADPEVLARALVGRRVLLFTGQAVAGAREDMRRAFFDVGAAEVECYWTDKSVGPERVPPDRLVVIDVSFMSHSNANRIDAMARRSKAWVCYTKAGSARIAQDVAARFVSRRDRL